MTSGAAVIAADSLRSEAKPSEPLEELGAARAAPGHDQATAPAANGCHPRVPVNSSSEGPATIPMENTVP